jgi:hypothetical protein
VWEAARGQPQRGGGGAAPFSRTVLPGSMHSEFSTMTRVDKPQKAGSSWTTRMRKRGHQPAHLRVQHNAQALNPAHRTQPRIHRPPPPTYGHGTFAARAHTHAAIAKTDVDAQAETAAGPSGDSCMAAGEVKPGTATLHTHTHTHAHMHTCTHTNLRSELCRQREEAAHVARGQRLAKHTLALWGRKVDAVGGQGAPVKHASPRVVLHRARTAHAPPRTHTDMQTHEHVNMHGLLHARHVHMHVRVSEPLAGELRALTAKRGGGVGKRSGERACAP